MNNRTDRPWGYFEILAENKETPPYWKLKKIVINPGQSISLQSHNNRDEIWKITSGTGIKNLKAENGIWYQNSANPGDVFHIVAKEKHMISALEKKPLEFLELATSLTRPIDEEDIIRFEDKYGRV
jgi:mannose-6-phosphate isomerase-like protein (cupin superfamily)